MEHESGGFCCLCCHGNAIMAARYLLFSFYFILFFLNKKIVQTVDDLLRSGEKRRIGSIIGR